MGMCSVFLRGCCWYLELQNLGCRKRFLCTSAVLWNHLTGPGMSSEPVPKKACTMVKLGTHNGAFHCDEVLACFLLKQLPQYKNAEIIRTRDPKLLEQCDIVVDVGGVYDPAHHRYDHHQRSFKDNMNSLRPEKKFVTKLSSAGLV